MKIRRLSIENLEHRRVLAGVAGPAWESVIVSLNDNVGDPRALGQGAINAHGGQIGHVYEHSLKGFSAQLPTAALAALAKNPNVKLIETDLAMQAFGQILPFGIDRIDGELNEVAKIDGIDNPGERVDVNIAIIDSGIDPNHPDLNVAGGTRFYTISSGPPRNRGSFQDGNFNDDYGHGSHVAGIAAALDNDFGVVGVAPGANLWAVKVLDANGSGYVSDIIKGIDWVTSTRLDSDTTNDIHVANMSLGGLGASSAYHNAIKASVNAGVVYVVAAGNSYRDILGNDFQFGTSDDTIPAAYPEVATISAMADTDGAPGGHGDETNYSDYFGHYADDSFADFSNLSNSDANYNSWYLQSTNGIRNNPVTSPGLGIDLMLPGVDIYSTYKNGGYATMSGTSMAAPHAAGLAALYIAEHGPATTAAQVHFIRQKLIDGGKGWESSQGLSLPTYGDSPDRHFENLGWAGSSQPVDQFPVVALSAPTAGALVYGSVNVIATASDDQEVSNVEFFVDAVSIGVDNDGSDGWSVTWNTADFPDGSHSLTARATDNANQQSTSSNIAVNVDNVDDPPSIGIDFPTTGAVVHGSVNVVAMASDDQAVSSVEFFVGTVSIGIDNNGSDGWSVTWNTTSYPDGSYSLTARATDSGNQQTVSSSVNVSVNNAVPATIHVGDLDAHSTSQGKTWTAFVTITVHDSNDAPVAGASVSGTWSDGSVIHTTTGQDGRISVSKNRIDKRDGLVDFTVTSVSKSGFGYDASENHDPDGDSSGTSISINKAQSASNTLVAPTEGVIPLAPSTLPVAVDVANPRWTAAAVDAYHLESMRQAQKEKMELNGALAGLVSSDGIDLNRDVADFAWTNNSHRLSDGGADLPPAVPHEFGDLLGSEDDDGRFPILSAKVPLPFTES